MKIKNFVKILAFAILVFSMLGCGKEEEKAEAEHITREKIVIDLIESMVRIPDSAEHKGLYFGKYEVTQEQWQEIMGNNPSYFQPSEGDFWSNLFGIKSPVDFLDLNRPVEQVSWNDCQEFISKLNARPEVMSAGIKFRLPTEEEWEYACRAGSTGKYGLLADGREGTIDEMGWYKKIQVI